MRDNRFYLNALGKFMLFLSGEDSIIVTSPDDWHRIKDLLSDHKLTDLMDDNDYFASFDEMLHNLKARGKRFYLFVSDDKAIYVTLTRFKRPLHVDELFE